LAQHVDAGQVQLKETQLTTLGIIVSELTTNALKYGRGHIRIRLSETDGNLTLVVEDEGTGFPENFPTPSGTGLGMRLVPGSAAPPEAACRSTGLYPSAGSWLHERSLKRLGTVLSVITK
jgi:two-component sensor histidine kinase